MIARKTCCLLLLGFALCGLGVYSAYPIFFTSPNIKTIPVGITILSTVPYPESLNRFIFLVYDISTINSSAKCELTIDLTLKENLTSNDTLVFLIPYKVETPKASFPSYSVQPSTYYNQSLEYSNISIPLQPQEGLSFLLTLTFTWQDCLRWTSFDTFDVIVPIGFTDTRAPHPNLPSKIIDPPDFSYTRISISDPQGCRATLYNPSTSKVHTFNARIWNSWIVDVQLDPHSPPLAAVRVEYIYESRANQKDLRIFLSGVLLGAGISVLVELVSSFLKEMKPCKKRICGGYLQTYADIALIINILN